MLTKRIDVEMLGPIDLGGLNRPEEDLLLLILYHFDRVYDRVSFTRSSPFLDRFKSDVQRARLLKSLTDKGFLTVISGGGGRGKQRHWTLGKNFQNVSLWREKTMYNGSCLEDGDSPSIDNKSTENIYLEQSTEASYIESGLKIRAEESGVTMPGGDPKHWLPKHWAQMWAYLYTQRHQTPPEKDMFGLACVRAGGFFHHHEHDVTPEEYYDYVWWLFDRRSPYGDPELLNTPKMFKKFRESQAKKAQGEAVPLVSISESFADDISVDDVNATEWDSLERLYGTERTTQVYGPRPEKKEKEEDDE